MTKLRYAEIDGLAGSSRRLTINFDDELNVFYGTNGTGKTSFLRILESALTNDATTVADVAFTHARIGFYSENYNALLERTLKHEISSKGRNAPRTTFLGESGDSEPETDEAGSLPAVNWNTKIIEGDSEPNYGVKFRHTYLPISRLNEVQLKQAINRHGELAWELDDFDFEEEIAVAWREYNAVSLYSIREVQQRGLADILSALFKGALRSAAVVDDAPIASDEAYSLVMDFLAEQRMLVSLDKADFVTRYRSQGELQEVVKKIHGINEEIEKATRSQRAFQETIERLYSAKKSIRFTRFGTIEVDTGGRRPLSLDRLSSGEKQLLRILLAVLGGETSPVMVDEPELSMHIEWQRELVSCMKEINPSCQLVLATHSPEIVGRVSASQVFEL